MKIGGYLQKIYSAIPFSNIIQINKYETIPLFFLFSELKYHQNPELDKWIFEVIEVVIIAKMDGRSVHEGVCDMVWYTNIKLLGKFQLCSNF